MSSKATCGSATYAQCDERTPEVKCPSVTMITGRGMIAVLHALNMAGGRGGEGNMKNGRETNQVRAGEDLGDAWCDERTPGVE